MLSVEQWPTGELPWDKYPEAWHLVAGSFEHAAARLLLTADERRAIDQLRDELLAAQRASAKDPPFDPTRLLLEKSAGLERALDRLVAAGRIATLLFAFLLCLAASELASAWSSPRFGWIAGLSIGLAPATAHYAATLNTDVPALAWLALAWALAANGAHGRRRATFLACGAAMGLAAATKDPIAAALPGVLWSALARRRDDAIPRGVRLAAIAAGAATTYVATSGLLNGWGATWRDHVAQLFGAGSEPFREFPTTLAGALGLLRATGDRLLAAGGLVGTGGLLLLLVTVALRRRWRALALLLPALCYVALFLLPIGYVYPRFTLPLCLSGAVAMAWSLAHLAGPGGRARRVWIGGLVALWSLGEASGVVWAKRSDARPKALAALTARRAPPDEVWVCAEPWFHAIFPPIAPPRRFLTLREVALALKRGEARPRFLWLAVDRREPFGAQEGLEKIAQQIGMRLVGRFETETSSPLVADRNGLLLPTVALFESEPR